MKQSLKAIAILCFILGIIESSAADSTENKRAVTNYEVLKINLRAGSDTSAAFFHAAGRQAVALVPGGVATKENYYHLARDLQAINIASLALDGRDEQAVLSAIDFLKKEGFDKISLVGGSIGAATILVTLKYTLMDEQRKSIDKIILIGPYGGSAIQNNDIKKLYIAAKEDSISPYESILELFNDTSEPKKLKVYEGSDHAELLFDGRYKEDITELILNFIRNK